MSLTAADKNFIVSQANAKAALEQTRTSALRGWLLVILPTTLCLVVVLLYGLQMMSGIQTYSLLSDPQRVGGGAAGGGVKVWIARLILAGIVLGAASFLWRMFQRGGAAFLVGGRMARQSIFQSEKRAEKAQAVDAAIAEMHRQNADLNSANQAFEVQRRQAEIAQEANELFQRQMAQVQRPPQPQQPQQPPQPQTQVLGGLPAYKTPEGQVFPGLESIVPGERQNFMPSP